ncbi:DUF6787 family protein [Aurantibacter sp.]|uniref:DUF6787 family protein n=1 Tax=Aurantibacter sp. TaxID=2807103 RepID=UPI0032655AF0
MQKFKERWEIQQNWQLIFPALGILGILYSSFKLAKILTADFNLFLTIGAAIIISFLLIKLCLFFFKKLENKWIVDYRWEMIRIFIVFAITGSSSVFVGRPVIKFLGINQENLNVFVYWVLFMLIGLFFYQIMLVFFGWLFGEFKFFWAFEKKMLRRMGLGFLFDKS